MKGTSGGRRRNVVLQRAVSVATLAAAGAVPAWAQNVQSGEKLEEVVVIGFRDALESAQAIKRDADTFVDSITATDIGAFPDKSVAEALQRVPGITTSRLQSSDDSNHFSAEPSTVLIRGLTFVRTEVNGRDTFSADGYRGLNFNDISPELMQGIDSYKNQTAEMIEGGIAGVVNLRTRVPFDSEGQVIALTGRVNYGDRSDEPTYEASGLYSNIWETDIGRFGAMVNGAYSHITTRTEAVNMHRISTFCSDYAGASGTLPAVVNSDGTIACNNSPYGGSGWRYAPNQVNFSQVDYDRKRYGAAVALQYENNDETVRVTLQGIDSRYKNPWLERSSNINFNNGAGFGTPSWSPFATPAWRPVTGAFNFGADGMLDSGVLGQPITASGFDSGNGGNINRGSAVSGLPFVNDCDMDPTTPGIQTAGCNQLTGSTVSNEARIFDHVEGTRDLSLNLQWDVTDRLRTSFDAQYIKAKTNNYDILVASNTLATANYSTNGDGTPQIQLTPAPNTNYAPGFLANPHNYWMQFIQDHWEDNDAEEAAGRFDVEYDLGSGGWLSSLKAGVRFADRDQKVRYSSYNWAPIAPSWSCNGAAFNVDTTTPTAYPAASGCPSGTFQGYPAGIWESTSLNSHFNGNVFRNGPMVFLSRDTLRNYDLHTEGLADRNINAPQGWNPLCDRTNTVDGCFTQAEIVDVNEKSKAAYLMLRFGGPDAKIFGDINVVGNIGVRYVKTDLSSVGSVIFPTAQWYNDALAGNQGGCNPSNNGPTQATDIQCWLTPELLAFSTGDGIRNGLDKSYSNVLPSFNVRFGITADQYIRFGYSRGMSRPDFGLLRNFVAINAPPIDTSVTSPYLIRDAQGNVTGYNFVFAAEAGYAGLEPTTADNFDLSYEAYISKSSSFTLGVFYKQLDNAIAYGRAGRAFTNNGTTQDVTIRGPSNGDGGGKIKGFEVAYQTFFDFLPGAWSGLGAQVNYTRTQQSDINNSNLAVQSGYIAGSTTAFGGGNNTSTGGAGNAGNPLSFASNVIDAHRLAGISDHSYNVVGLYEYGSIAARLAYSWRSEFLTANLDCCIGLPMWQEDSGYLDGSVRYQVNDALEVSLDVSNILDTTAVMQQQVFGDSPGSPGAKPVKIDSGWTRNDRRFQLGVRFRY